MALTIEFPMSEQLAEVLRAECPQESDRRIAELNGSFGLAPCMPKEEGLSDLAVEAAKLLALQVVDCGQCEVPAALVGVMPDSSLVSLEAIVTARRPLGEHATAEVAAKFFVALAHLHSQGILHRNLTPEHVCLNPSGGVVLSGMGNSCHIDDSAALCRRVGTPGFVAPEVVVGKESTLAVDSFGAGATLYFALRGTPPFTGDLEKRLRKTIHSKVHLDADGPLGFASEGCRRTLRALLQRDPKDRPSAGELLTGPWWPCDVAWES